MPQKTSEQDDMPEEHLKLEKKIVKNIFWIKTLKTYRQLLQSSFQVSPSFFFSPAASVQVGAATLPCCLLPGKLIPPVLEGEGLSLLTSVIAIK